jgi:hypothetical protein
MSFLFEPFFGVVELSGEEGVVRALGSWENRVTVTTPDDIGRLTAMIVFEEKESVKNEVVFTAGDTVSYEGLADTVEGVLGRKVRREVWTVEKLERELREDKESAVRKYRVAFAVGKGVSWERKKTWNWQRGVEATDVKSYALNNLPQVVKGTIA